MSGGRMSTNGGISQSGMETTSASSARTVRPIDRAALPRKEAPFFLSSAGKRRSATSRVKAGAMNAATMSNDTTTISGVAASTTTSGANMAAGLLEKNRPIQFHKPDIKGQASSALWVQATAASQ